MFLSKAKSKAPAETLPVVSNNSFSKKLKDGKYLLLLVVPTVICLALFYYLPMYGVTIAFMDYKPFKGFAGSEWVGFANFQRFFSYKFFFRTLKNTMILSVCSLFWGFPAPIILSLLLNEIRHSGYKRTVQTLIYIPHFISWVIVASLTYQLFNVSDGIIHEVMELITGQSIDILSKGSAFWGLIVGQDIWRETGYGTIVFLAALAGVDQEMYEAARVDGAGRWKLMWHITLPAIRGTIIMMLILTSQLFLKIFLK